MKKIRENIAKLGLDEKKEFLFLFLYILLISAGFAGLYFLIKRPFIFIFIPISIALVAYLYLSRYAKQCALNSMKLTDDFVEIFTYFDIYISNGYNVYNALEECSQIAKGDLSDKIKELLKHIDEDKSLNPFIIFAGYFDSLEVKQVLLSVYQMVDEGGGNAYLSQFKTLFGKFSEQRHKEIKERKKSLLSSLSILPLLGSGITMLSLTAALIEIMGSIYNVL